MGEMAAVYAGGVAAGIYPTDTPAQVAYKAEHSAAVRDEDEVIAVVCHSGLFLIVAVLSFRNDVISFYLSVLF
jgi:hypothetical protein